MVRRRQPPSFHGGAHLGTRLVPTLALTAVTLVTAAGMGRLFAGADYLVPVLVAALAAHAVALLLRKARVPLAPSLLVSGIAVLLAGVWLVFPHVTFWGIPDASTWRAVGQALSQARLDFLTMRAPVPTTPGFLFLAVLAIGCAAALADAGALRLGTAAEGLLPAFAVFIFTAGLGTSRGRALAVTTWLAAVLVFLLVVEVEHRWRSATRFGAGGGGRRLLLLGGGSLLVVAVLVGAAVGPSLPGAGATALVNWHNQQRPGQRTAISPLVDIRAELLKPSNVQVFTVSSPVASYWRLTALDTFNGTQWSANDSYTQVGNVLPGTGGPEQTQAVTEHFTIQSLDSTWLPAAYRPVAISGVGAIFNARSASLIADTKTAPGLRYTVRSSLPRFTPAELRTARVQPSPSMARFLALPPSIPRSIWSLAARVVAGQTTPYGKALALQDFFRRNFTYSLDVPPSDSTNALVRFLFDTHKGYCQQFAGAYAVMARMVGLPSRVAVGFTPGQLGPDGLYHVRALNAHAWPEVDLGDFGWVAFEPTPGRGAPGATEYTGVAQAQASPITPRPVVPTTQATTAVTKPFASSPPAARAPQLSHVRTQGRSSRPPVPGQPSSMLPDTGLALASLLGLLLLAWAAVPAADLLRRGRRRARAGTPAERVLVAFAEAAEAVARAGWPRHPAETFGHYARRVSPRLPPAAALALSALAMDAQEAAFAAQARQRAGGSREPDPGGQGGGLPGAGPRSLAGGGTQPLAGGRRRSLESSRRRSMKGARPQSPAGGRDQSLEGAGRERVRAARAAADEVRAGVLSQASAGRRLAWRFDPRPLLGLDRPRRWVSSGPASLVAEPEARLPGETAVSRPQRTRVPV